MLPSSRFQIALLKALILVLFVAAAITLVHFTPFKGWFTTERLNGFLTAAGLWAPLLFILLFALGSSLFIPYTVFLALGVLLFGVYWGSLCVWVGSVLGASVSFIIGRTLGRDFAAHLIGDRLSKYDDGIERHGFTTVLYLRLAYLPYIALNFGLGLTKVRFWDYFWASGLALLVVTIIFTLAVNAIREAWLLKSWLPMASWQVLFAAGLFGFSLFLPRIMKNFVERPIQSEAAIWNGDVPGKPDSST
ncbi:MAG TPA: TVP38/TMEM64 family protein [Syntrophobacteraceae bacterium]|nr:TVP38/TMEM64 family protein [Syntrophobacteraceae bacterium]HBD08697.1 TVP38/TMEM64 family protein [Syntrophobacteraceae bacterium]HBZ54593.1 TVP38/TMEM64 family protein [Syntrophobacteraceae bacterium]